MSRQLISHSPDLQQLWDEGYDIEIRGGHLLVRNVPYVNSRKEIAYGTLVSVLTLAGGITTAPADHVAKFIGDHPCYADGAELHKIKHSSQTEVLDRGLVVQHTFSAKPTMGAYANYYHKMTTYAEMLCAEAQRIDPNVTARPCRFIEAEDPGDVFQYQDTASSRAGIMAVSRSLEIAKVAIVGLGGTGSYVLDLIAKTPVGEVHLFDSDRHLQHNAFRSPGAPSIEDLRQIPQKVAYFQAIYSRMHRGIIAHDVFINADNVDELAVMDFTFLCLDQGEAKRLIVERLEVAGKPFIDVGLGVKLDDGALGGILRVTASTPQKRDHVQLHNRIPFSDGGANNDYSRNIQVADLNALNAALAVVKWKKIMGFYRDLEREHFSAYTIDGNMLTNEDRVTRQSLLAHEFVEYIPKEVREGTVYVCVPFATVVHKCCCGCGLEVVTPLSPTDWRLTFDGETISLDPSIGSWSFPCRSHYWIRENRVKWAAQWSQRAIDAGRANDRRSKQQYFDEATVSLSASTAQSASPAPQGFWQRIKRRWLR